VKKLLAALGILAIAALAAVLIGPSFIDWSRYKGEIAARVEAATGRALTIEGGVSLALLPTPRLTIEDVRLANLSGASDPDLARVKILDARVAFIPLLTGRIRVESLDLVEPQLNFERLADGRINWILVPEVPASTGRPASSTPPPDEILPGWLTPDHLAITNGVIRYRDDRTGEVQTLSQINGGLSAGSPRGPFRAQGHATAANIPLTFEATLQRLGGTSPTAVGLRLGLTGAQLDFNGKLVPGETGTELNGKLRFSGVDLRAIAATVAGRRPTSLPPFLAQNFVVEAALAASGTKIALNGLALRLGDSEASGGAVFEPGTPDRAALTFSLSRVDLDKWLAMKDPAAHRNSGTDVAAALLGESVRRREPTTAPASAVPSPFALPSDLEATLDANIDALIYRGDVVRQIHLGATLHRGELALDQLSASLPGSSDVTAYGALRVRDGQPSFSGNLEGNADNLRGLLGWLKLDVGQIPAERLRKLSLSTALDVTPQQLELRDVDMVLDSSHLVGGATILLQSRPAFGASLAIDRLNLDAYLPESANAAPPTNRAQATGDASGAARQKAPPLVAMADRLQLFNRFDANIRARVDELIYRGQDIRGVALDGTVQGGNITLREASVEDLAGMKGTLRGTFAGLADKKPTADVTFEASAASLATFLRFASLPLPIPADQIGALAVKGRFRGDDTSLGVTGLKAQSGLLDAAGDVVVSGLPDKPQITTSLTASTSHPGALAALAGFGIASTLDALGATQISVKTAALPDGTSIDATVAASGGSLSLTGTVAAGNGAPLRYDLTVNASHPDLAALLRIMAPAYRPAARKLGALEFTGKLSGGGDGFALSDMAAKLGPVSFKGDLDGAFAGPRPKFDLRLSADAIDIGSLLPAAKTEATARQTSDPPPAETDSRWSDAPLELGLLKSADANLSLSTPSLTYGHYRLEDATVTAAVSDGVLDLSELAGRLYGGDFKLTGKLDARTVPNTALALRLSGADLGAAELAIGALHLAKGKLTISADLAASGGSERALIQGLNGNGAFAMEGGEIEGFNLAAASARLGKPDRATDLLRMVETGLSGGASKVAHLAGTVTVANGVAKNTDLAIDADGAVGQGHGTIDLPRWYMDYTVDFKLTGAADAPPVAVTLKGAPDAPRKFLNANEFQEYLLKRGVGAAFKDTGKASQEKAPGPDGENPTTAPKSSSPQEIIQNLLKSFEKKP